MVAYFLLVITIASTIAVFTGAYFLRKQNLKHRATKGSAQSFKQKA